MTAGSIVPTLPVPLLRDGLGREAASLSLRGVAREVGMSPNGVRDFLQGAIPRSATRVKLERWLATRGKVTRPPNVGQFVRLLSELSVDLSPGQTLELGRALAELLVERRQAAVPHCGVQAQRTGVHEPGAGLPGRLEERFQVGYVVRNPRKDRRDDQADTDARVGEPFERP